VGPSFSIDPVTVGTVANPQDVSYGYQGRILYGNGYYWLFYLDVPSNSYVYRSSSDGLTWSAATAVSTSGLKAVGGESVFVSGTTVYFATVSARTSRYLYYNTGTLGSGAITWGTEQSVAVANYPSGTESAVDIAADSNGKVWIVYLGCTYSNCGSGTQMQQQVYTNQGGSWAQSLASRDEGFEGQGAGQLVPLTLGKMAFIYNPTTSALPEAVDIQEWSGSSWSAPVATSGKGYDTVSSFTHIGDTVVGVLDSSSFLDSVYFEEFPYGSTAWYQTTLTTSGLDGGISTDGTSLISVFYWTSYCSLRYTTSSNLGSSWSAVETLTSPGKYDLTSSAVDPAYASGGLVSMVWGAGSSSPYDLEFAAIPDPVPTAATSSKPWSRAGLSPYESYFSEFSDYVSPGNGLVAVEAGTFDLPGRGLSFAPTLVYSEPYAFRSSGSPYLYDNYTGASLGYGWSLNLPWMGANYLHLADGQAYPYSWSGNTFQYNGVTNFVLTANSGGTYTLTMPSGTVYQFDSSRRLASITDRTGNNVFTFSYGANGYVSQVTDTVGRTISFTYNSNNHLVSITSGTRTWTLGYTGNLLTSLTDPLSRVTTFQYAGTTGADAWLLSAVDWPTGGRVTYTYGSAPVGTEVSTYYATARDVYYDSTHLSQSQSISYTIVNGQVTWSNTTLSDGTTVRSYLDINFQSSKNLMKTYEKDGSGVLQGVT
ncbi:MAG TPA: hypothetical protein VJR06_08765, partial [Nitrososphaerales archaeon]|nr:hypothetical protein [Nitrososphaerales archaeon]